MNSLTAVARMSVAGVITAVAACAALACMQEAGAQSYPTRALRIVVPYAPGGNTDFTARSIAAKLKDVFGQAVVVENRPGASRPIGNRVNRAA